MLTFKSRIDTSPIHGRGLFTAEPLQAEQILWRFDPSEDKKYTAAEYESLSEEEMTTIKYWGYLDPMDGYYYLTGGNDRFTNHSAKPNTYIDDEGYVRAIRDIAADEEITCDYRTFDGLYEHKFAGKLAALES